MLPFVGVDGEGANITDANGFTHHRYTMLRAGVHTLYGEDNRPEDWLAFLGRLPKKHIYVGFFFDYDVTMMLRDMPEEHLRVLIGSGQVTWADFQIGYRARKELWVKHHGKVTTVNDVGTFFQCRFVTALERWNIGTPEQRAAIGEGKEQRSEFVGLTDEIVAYNRMECDLLVELMSKFRRTCETIGYLPVRWQGPGQLAKAMFRKHAIPKTVDLPEPPPGVWEMAQAAYYGGRFEPTGVGPIKGPVDGWDICSAYPHAATLLPCLVHGGWKPTRTLASMGVFRVSFDHRREQMWYGLPVRMADGSIRFPRRGHGWYWGVELQASLRLGARLDIKNGWLHSVECSCKPFDFMHRMYSLRQGIGKSEAGIALKLAMNSAYGITAQSVGKAPYANPVWAGLFTAITRARLVDAVSQDPHAVYMLATDGLFCRAGALDLPESNELGGWERTAYPEGMFIVQSGVYFAGDHKPKTRGVPQTAVLREESALRGAWHGAPTDGLNIGLHQFVGLRLGLARNRLDTAGEWFDVTKTISFDWATKRRPHTLRRGLEGARTMPYDGSMDVATVPYEKLIGGNLARHMDRLEFADTPDWAEVLTENL